jgi:hypothetical protein
MIVAESRTGRRLVGRLDRGVDLFAAILDVCRAHGVRSGEVRALGSLEAAELAEYDQAAKHWKPSRRYTGGFEVLHLQGNVSEKDGQAVVHAHATLMRDTDNGVLLLGGHVVSARVFAIELVVDAWDDLILRRGVDEPTGLTQWREIITVPTGAAPPAPPPPAPELSWQQVAAASAHKDKPPAPPPHRGPQPPRPSASAIDAEVLVTPGDVILHPRFGRCQVVRIEGADEFARVRLPNGNMVRLSLEVLDLTLDAKDGDRRVFRAKVE